MRKPVIAGNWKLFKKTSEAIDLVNALIPLVKQTRGVEIVIAPVFTVLGMFPAGLPVRISPWPVRTASGRKKGPTQAKFRPDAGGCRVQSCHHRPFRTAPVLLRDRRNRQPENPGGTRRGLSVLFCIGETLEERESDRTFVVLKSKTT